MSPEGGVFDLMAGLYSKNGIPQFNVYLMGHSGDDLTTDRVSRKSVHVQRPAITCAYAVQPAVIRGLARHPAFRGRGLLARFLYAAPCSPIGRRKIAPPPVSDAGQKAYRCVVRRLAELKGEFMLHLTDAAAASFKSWETEIETMLDDGQLMETIRDWGSKLVGETLRLAAVLHCVVGSPNRRIARTATGAAIEIARYLVSHADAVLKMMEATESTASDDARYLLRWIERHGRGEFAKTEAQHHGKRRFPKADAIDAALAELTRRSFIRPLPTKPAGAGRPPSPTFEVNQAAFKSRTPEKRSHNSRNSSDVADGVSFGNIGSAFQQHDESEAEPDATPGFVDAEGEREQSAQCPSLVVPSRGETEPHVEGSTVSLLDLDDELRP